MFLKSLATAGSVRMHLPPVAKLQVPIRARINKEDSLRTKTLRHTASLVLAGALALAGLAFAGGVASANSTPPSTPGASSAPDIQKSSKDNVSPPTAPKGGTALLPQDAAGRPMLPKANAIPQTGYNSSVDFTSPYNYCYGNETATPVVNHSGVTQYFEVYLYNNGASRTYYTSVGAYGTAWPYFYGVSGTYYAYLYVWNGSSYAYDEYQTSSNNCAVGVQVSKSVYSGYLYASITNTGTDYAWVELNELAPYHTYGTYTGDHWYYLAPGGAVSQYIYVGVGLTYGVYSDVLGSMLYVGQWSGAY